MATLKDRDTLGALAGIGGVLARDAWSFFAKQIGLAKFYVWGLAADIFLDKSQVKTAGGTVIGLAADMVMGALIGVAYFRFLQWGRDRNPLIKGLGFGLGVWLLLFGILLHTLPHTAQSAPSDARSILSSIVGHAVFGSVMGILGSLLLRLLDRDEGSWTGGEKC